MQNPGVPLSLPGLGPVGHTLEDRGGGGGGGGGEVLDGSHMYSSHE